MEQQYSSSTLTKTITVAGVSDAPTFNTSGLTASGNEDTVINLPSITSALLTDSSEALTVTISGIPSGAIIKIRSN